MQKEWTGSTAMTVRCLVSQSEKGLHAQAAQDVLLGQANHLRPNLFMTRKVVKRHLPFPILFTGAFLCARSLNQDQWPQ